MVPDQAAVDVNALMTALAQASAALIAIVGGLLVSRYVTLHAEQQGAQRRLDDIDRRLIASKDERAEAVREWNVYLAEDLLEDERVYEEVVKQQYRPTVRGVLEALDHDGDNLNHSILDERLTALAEEMHRAISAMSELIPQATQHASWSGFQRDHAFEIGQKDAWEWAYKRICRKKTHEARKAAAAARAAERGPFASLGMNFIVPPIEPIPQIMPRASVLLPSGKTYRERLLDRIDEADAEVRALSHERELVQETYDATTQPEGFNLALQVLSLLAVLGMGLPVAVMAIPLTALPTSGRVLVVLVVALGVGLLLRYLFVYAAYLKDGGRTDLPKSMFGLIPWPRRRVKGRDQGTSDAPDVHTSDHKGQ